MDFNDFKTSTLNAAYRAGVSEEKPFSVVILGPLSQFNRPIPKRLTVSYISPPSAHQASPEELWLNPTNLTLYRLSRTGDTWSEVYAYDDVWVVPTSGGSGSGTVEPGESVFNGDTAIAPVYLNGDPTTDMQAANKHYVDKMIAEKFARLAFTNAVATIPNLRSLNVSTLSDKTLIFVESVEKIYAYDLEATGIDDGINIIKPNVGVGRWKTTSATTVDGGSF